MRDNNFIKVLRSKIKDFLTTLYLLKRNQLTRICLYVILFLFLLAVIGPAFLPSAAEINENLDPANKLLPPSAAHWFGTDELGRDIFQRVILGTRISMFSAVLTLAISIAVGVSLGAIAGFLGGAVDDVIMRIVDIFQSFPSLLLAMTISAFLGASLQNAIIAIAVSTWPNHARIVRNQAVTIRERQFVKASYALGAPAAFIICKHIVPNCVAPIIVKASMDFGNVVMTLASLSFLGLGAQAPTPEWGLMVSTSRNYFMNAWWTFLFPGIAIFITVLCFNLIGDGLREVLDPKTRKN